MQTVDANWAGYLTSPNLNINFGVQMSFTQALVTSSFFTIGTSLIGGPDIIKSGGADVAFFDKFQYTDYTPYLVSFDVQQRVSQYPYGIIMAQADVTLDNSTNLFSPYYDPTIGAYILAGRPLKLSMGFNGEVLQQFTGFTTNPQRDTKEMTLTYQAYDVFNYISTYQSTTTGVQVNQRADQIIAAGLAEMGFSSTQYVLDQSLMEPIPAMAPYGLYWGDIFQSLCEGEQALMFADENGIIHFWNRQHMLENSTVVQTLDYTVIEQLQTEDTPIINDVIVTAYPRQIAADQQVWTLAAAQLLAPGQNTIIEADFSDDEGVMPVTTLDTPAAYSGATTSSYQANSAPDGSGTDMTGSITYVSKTNWGSTAYIEFNNPTAEPIYLTSLVLWGTPAKVTTPVTVRYTDATSVAAYGTNPGNNGQVLQLGPDYIQDSDTAYSVGYTLVNEFKDGRQRYLVTMLANPAIQLGDSVELVLQDGFSLSLPDAGTASGSASGLPATNGSFSVGIWFNITATDASRHDLISLLNGTSGLQLVLNGTTLEAEKGSGTVLVSSSSSPATGEWHRVLYTFDGTHNTLYLDGVQVGTSTTGAASVTPNEVRVSTKDGTNEPFNGLLDTAQVWNVCLTASQAASDYKGSMTFTGMVSQWLFNEGTGTTAFDSIGSNNLTLDGTYAAWQALGCYGIKTMYVVGRTIKVSQDDIYQQLDLEERLILSYFTIGTSLIGGTDMIAP